jgi:transposase-like protein
MRGRHASGPEFVQRLSGEDTAKRRLEVILHTVAGQLRVQEAAAELGITTQRLHQLRAEALQAGVDQLTPRPLGRPWQVSTFQQQRIAELQEEIERLRRELVASQVRAEIADCYSSRGGEYLKGIFWPISGKHLGKGTFGKQPFTTPESIQL